MKKTTFLFAFIGILLGWPFSSYAIVGSSTLDISTSPSQANLYDFIGQTGHLVFADFGGVSCDSNTFDGYYESSTADPGAVVHLFHYDLVGITRIDLADYSQYDSVLFEDYCTVGDQAYGSYYVASYADYLNDYHFNSTSTSPIYTQDSGNLSFALAIIIVILFLMVVAMLFNKIFKRKLWL